MNKKGFTLIELLAVIVVLAIIALIATPLVMNTITKAQEGADLRSVEGYAKAVEAAYYEGQITETDYTIEDAATDAVYSGAQVTECTPTLENNAVKLTGCKVNGKGNFTYSAATGASKIG